MEHQIRKEINLEYKEYQHIVKLDNPEVDGLLVGKCFIFPKIDGTNASVWYQGTIGTGSRHRDLSKEGSSDNAGFRDYIKTDSRYPEFFKKYPHLRLYGEWLIPHTLKTYRDDAWRKFYVFDVTVYDPTTGEELYIPYEVYKEWLNDFGIDYIPPIKIITDPDHDQLQRCVDINTFLIEEDSGVGEGIVIKNYNFVNGYGRIVWGKIVRNEFKDKLHKEQGAPEMINLLLEKEMVDKYLTRDIVDKVYSNILNENLVDILKSTDEMAFEKKWIPRLLEQSFHDFYTEECWNIYKYTIKNKHRSIDLKNLRQHALNKVKEFYPQLFRRNVNENQSS